MPALESEVTVAVGNASHMRNVPGRKTDVNDAEWIADLVRHGLVRASFVPPPEVRMLRELVSHRKALAGIMAAERNRTLQLLEGAGIKLAGVMSDVFGVSGMLMLRALIEGGADAATMADLAKRRLRRKSISLPRHWTGSLPRISGSCSACISGVSKRSTATWRRSKPRSSKPCSRLPPSKPYTSRPDG
jgi:transposase